MAVKGTKATVFVQQSIAKSALPCHYFNLKIMEYKD